jgi:hypothetical protein
VSRYWYALFIASVYLTACMPNKPKFIPPKEAESAIAIAKRYAETNGCRSGTVWGAKLEDNVWLIELEATGEKLAFVRAGKKGQPIVWFVFLVDG